MYKVFVNDKLIRLIDDYSDYESDDHTLFLRYYSREAIAFSVDLLAKNKTMKQLVIYHNDLEDLWENFSSHYTLISASGGLVKNEQGNVLFIYKRGKWDLPKGKVDEGEALKDAAMREVKEECGIEGLEVVRELDRTYHIYSENSENILKQTHWFEMKSDFNGDFQVDKNEGIEKASWLDEKELKTALENTYPSIVNLCTSSLTG